MFNSLLTRESANLHHLKFFTLIHLPAILKMVVTKQIKRRKQEYKFGAQL